MKLGIYNQIYLPDVTTTNAKIKANKIIFFIFFNLMLLNISYLLKFRDYFLFIRAIN
jgi:hypothetical protein